MLGTLLHACLNALYCVVPTYDQAAYEQEDKRKEAEEADFSFAPEDTKEWVVAGSTPNCSAEDEFFTF